MAISQAKFFCIIKFSPTYYSLVRNRFQRLFQFFPISVFYVRLFAWLYLPLHIMFYIDYAVNRNSAVNTIEI